MRRSAINAALARAEAWAAARGVHLPDFWDLTPADWADIDPDTRREVVDCELGWDVTDFGGNDFEHLGLTLFTLRNGRAGSSVHPKPYAEKALFIGVGQVTPLHFHLKKMEDIINRGGGDLVFHLYNATKDEGLADTDVEINQDGRRYVVKAGADVVLKPGDSLTLYPYYYHDFVVSPGTGTVLLGEVSMCNDDNSDNRFLQQYPRFPTIEEDEPAHRLLCTEYPKAAD